MDFKVSQQIVGKIDLKENAGEKEKKAIARAKRRVSEERKSGLRGMERAGRSRISSLI